MAECHKPLLGGGESIFLEFFFPGASMGNAMHWKKRKGKKKEVSGGWEKDIASAKKTSPCLPVKKGSGACSKANEGGKIYAPTSAPNRCALQESAQHTVGKAEGQSESCNLGTKGQKRGVPADRRTTFLRQCWKRRPGKIERQKREQEEGENVTGGLGESGTPRCHER